MQKRMTVQLHHNTHSETPLGIVAYMHCGMCIKEWKEDPKINTVQSPAEYSRTQTGVQADGSLQVWCNRHNVNVDVITVHEKMESVS